jgi:hypothetical protein
LLLPNDSALLPPLCIWRMKKQHEGDGEQNRSVGEQEGPPRAFRDRFVADLDPALINSLASRRTEGAPRPEPLPVVVLHGPVMLVPAASGLRRFLLPGRGTMNSLKDEDGWLASGASRQVPHEGTDDDEHHQKSELR